MNDDSFVDKQRDIEGPTDRNETEGAESLALAEYKAETAARLYLPASIGLAGFLGGPPGGALILAMNFWRLNRRGAALVSMLVGLLSLLAVVFVIAANVADSKLVNFVVAIVSAALCFLVAQITLGETCDTLVAAGMRPASAGRAAGWSILLHIGLVAAVQGALIGVMGRHVIAGKNQEIYYSQAVGESTARQLVESLQQDQVFERDQACALQIGRLESGEFWLSFIVDADDLDADDRSQDFGWFVDVAAAQSPKIFGGRLAEVRLCNEWFRPWMTIAMAGHAAWEDEEATGGKLNKEHRYPEAEQAHRRSVAIAERFGAHDYRLVISLNNVANQCLHQNKWAEAEQALTRALKTGSTLGPKCYAIGYTLTCLGRTYAAQCKYEQAEDQFRRALEVHRRLSNGQVGDLMRTIDGLAHALVCLKEYSAAESFLSNEIASASGLPEGADLVRDQCVLLQAWVFVCQDKFAAAETLLRQELPRYESEGRVSASLDRALELLGDALYGQRHFAAAESTYHRRWEFLSHEDRNPSVITAALDLAIACHAQDKMAAAEAWYREALTLDRALNKQATIASLAPLANLGLLCERCDRDKEAEDFLRRALALCEAHGSPDQPFEMLCTLSRVCAKLGKLADAEDFYRQALAADVSNGDHDAGTVGYTRACLAIVCQLQEKWDEAESEYLDALKTMEQHWRADNPSLIWARRNWAEMCIERGRVDDAESLFRRTVEDIEKLNGREDVAVAAALSDLASFYAYRGQLEPAESLFQRVVAIREKTLGPQDPSLAGAFHSLALVAEQQGNLEESVKQLENSLAILEKELGEEHVFVGAILDKYAELLRKLGREDDAQKVDRRVQRIRERHRNPQPPLMPLEGLS